MSAKIEAWNQCHGDGITAKQTTNVTQGTLHWKAEVKRTLIFTNFINCIYSEVGIPVLILDMLPYYEEFGANLVK